MMTEANGRTLTLMGRDALDPKEPVKTDDICIRGEDLYTEPTTATDTDGSTIVRGTDTYNDSDEARRFDDESREKAVKSELTYFANWLDIKVKDELMVQVTKNGEDATVDVSRVASLLEFLIKDEHDSRFNSAYRIGYIEIPRAYGRIDPTGRAFEYSVEDIDMLDWHYQLQCDLVDGVSAIQQASQEGYLPMAEEYVARLLPVAREELRTLRAQQAEEDDPQTDTGTLELLHEQVVEHLTLEAKQYAT